MTSNPDHSVAPRDLHGEDELIEEAYASPAYPADDLQEIENSVDNLQSLAGQMKQQTAIPGKILSPAASINPQFTQQLALNLDADAALPETVIIENNPSGAAKKQETRQESRKEAQKPTASAAPPAPPARRLRAGDVLREARLLRGWEIDSIAEEIKIKPSYLEAIEENRYSDLPSRTHAVGFARTYAQLLDINEDEIAKLMRHDVVTALPSAAPNMAAFEEKHSHTGSSMPGSSLVIFCVALALFVYAVGYGFFRPAAETEDYPSITAALPEAAKLAAASPSAAPQVSSQLNAPALAAQGQQAPAQQVPVTATPVATSAAQLTSAIASYGQANPQTPVGDMPVVAAPSQAMPQALPQPILPQLAEPASSAAPQAGQLAEASPANLPVARTARPSRIRLQALAPITVQIFDAGGHMLASRTIAKGEAFFIPDKTNYTMATNNAGALRLQVDGRDMPPLGAMEEPMHNIPLNADELLSALN